MLLSIIVVAALLFVVAVVILADACRPMLLLHLDKVSRPEHDDPRSNGHNEEAYEMEGVLLALSDEDRYGFLRMWDSVREEFQVHPKVTVLHADLLMSDLIEDYKGPVRGEDKSRYWSAHEIALRSRKGWAKPNELERAMGLYAVLFDELLGTGEPPREWEGDPAPIRSRDDR